MINAAPRPVIEVEAGGIRYKVKNHRWAIVTNEALKDPKIARWMAATLRKNATRDVDQKEIAGLLTELDDTAQKANQP